MKTACSCRRDGQKEGAKRAHEVSVAPFIHARRMQSGEDDGSNPPQGRKAALMKLPTGIPRPSTTSI